MCEWMSVDVVPPSTEGKKGKKKIGKSRETGREAPIRDATSRSSPEREKFSLSLFN